MNQSNDKIRIESEPFRQFTSTLYQSAGVPKIDAVAVAGMQVDTDERGVFHTEPAPSPAMCAAFSTAKSIRSQHRRF